MINLLIIPLAFLCGLFDSTLGMGYGTTLTPILLLMGFEPLQIVPVVLLSQIFAGGMAAFVHQKFGNVHFDFRNKNNSAIKNEKKLFYLPKSNDARIASVLSLTGVIGAIFSVLLVVNLSQITVKGGIGSIIFIMGFVILRNAKKIFKFSWPKIIGLGAIAAFNKGLSGGGYGPLVCSGQILSGIKTKSAIAITALSESVTSLVAVIMYFFIEKNVDWQLAPYLIIGAVLSVPLSGFLVKKFPMKKLTVIIGITTILLGGWTLIKTFIL